MFAAVPADDYYEHIAWSSENRVEILEIAAVATISSIARLRPALELTAIAQMIRKYRVLDRHGFRHLGLNHLRRPA